MTSSRPAMKSRHRSQSPLGPGVDVQRRRHTFAKKFLIHERNAFHVVEIVPSGLIGEQTVVRRRDQSDVKPLQRADDFDTART